MAYWIDFNTTSNANCKSFYCDYISDIGTLPRYGISGVEQGCDTVSHQPCSYGSTCFCIENGAVYILKKDTNEWTAVSESEGGGSDNLRLAEAVQKNTTDIAQNTTDIATLETDISNVSERVAELENIVETGIPEDFELMSKVIKTNSKDFNIVFSMPNGWTSDSNIEFYIVKNEKIVCHGTGKKSGTDTYGYTIIDGTMPNIISYVGYEPWNNEPPYLLYSKNAGVPYSYEAKSMAGGSTETLYAITPQALLNCLEFYQYDFYCKII